MKRIILLILLIAFGVSVSASEADDIRTESDGKLGLNNQGTEFWLSIPDMFYDDYREKFHLLITTAKENKVTITYLSTGQDSTFNLEANSAKLIQIYPNRKFGYNYEFGPKRTKLLKLAAIKITSEKYISAQTLNYFYGYNNGTILQPLSSLSNHYMIQTYYSNPYKDRDSTKTLPPEITVTSPYNENKVKLMLAKSNENLTIRLDDSTEYKAGDTVEVTMQKGDVWYINSIDTTGDLSGSIIKSSKPVHITYSHYVFLFKNTVSNNDIHTTLFPTEQWDKEYFIPSFYELNKHPIIRVYTQHDDTKIYRNGELWISIDNTFENEVFESSIWPVDYEIENNEPTIITSDKPISILIFPDYSLNKDSVNIANDNVSTLIPTTQFVNNASFSLLSSRLTNPDSENKKNMLEIYYISNKNEITEDIEFAIFKPNNKLIEWNSLKLDTSGVFESKEINDRYYCRYNIEIPDSCTVYIRSGEVLFNGFYYNVDRNNVPFLGEPPTIDYLAFPISSNSLDLTSTDTTTPKVTLNKMSNKTHGIVYDYDENASGLAELYVLEEYSYNYDYKLLSADDGFIENEDGNSFISGDPMQLEFELTKKDGERDAFAVLYTTDKAGNDTLIFVNEELFTSVGTETNQYITIYNDEIVIDNSIIFNKSNELIIFNLNGSKVKSLDNIQTNRISIGELKTGVYFILLKTNDEFFTYKFNLVR